MHLLVKHTVDSFIYNQLLLLKFLSMLSYKNWLEIKEK